MDKSNPMWPFYGPKYEGNQTVYGSVEDRLNAVKSMDRETLEAALMIPGLQKTVERAIHSKLNKLGVK